MSGIPHEQSGDELEWERLFRVMRNKALDLIENTSDPHEFVMLTDAIDTLTGIDPTYGSVTVSPGDPSTDDHIDPDDDEEGDEDDDSSPVPAPVPNPNQAV